MSIENKFNELNNIWVRVDWTIRRVDIIDAETGSVLLWKKCFDREDGRIYPSVDIPYTNGTMLVHRLVAYTFKYDEYLEKREEMSRKGIKGRPIVDHIDNNPLNAMPDNLRWCTEEENREYRKMQPAYKKGA